MATRVKTRIDAVERSVVAFVQPDLAPDAQAEFRARVAREHLNDAQQQNRAVIGRVPEHDTFVDGRAEAPLQSVKPSGVIVFEFEFIKDVLIWIHQALVKHSPRLKGDYEASHALFADGEGVDDLSAIPDATEFVFVNLQPYARKIERGQSKQAPDGVYEGVAALAKKRFGNVARVRFSFRAPIGNSALESWASRTALTGAGRGLNSRARAEWLRRQPAIVVTAG